MQFIEIIVIIACALIVAAVVICAIVRRLKGKPGCGCDCASCPGCAAQKKRENKEKKRNPGES